MKLAFALWLVPLLAPTAGALQGGSSLGPYLAQEAVNGAEILVVDADGSGDFLDLPPAVAAADDGDLILVRAAATAYAGFSVDGKGIAVVASGGGVPSIETAIEVSGLSADQLFALRGFDVSAVGSVGGVLELSQNEGAVWIEDCSVRALGVPATPYTAPVGSNDGMLVTDCANVVVMRSTIDGIEGSATSPSARAAMRSVRSRVACYESSFIGPDGSDGLVSVAFNCINNQSSTVWSQSQRGGVGVLVEGGFFFAADTTFRGGDGGQGACCLAGAPVRCGLFSWNGGAGLEVSGLAEVEVLGRRPRRGQRRVGRGLRVRHGMHPSVERLRLDRRRHAALGRVALVGDAAAPFDRRERDDHRARSRGRRRLRGVRRRVPNTCSGRRSPASR